MSRSIRIAAVALLALAAACADQEPPTAASGSAGGSDAAAAGPEVRGPDAVRAERLARRLALALGDSGYRAELHAELERSPVPERKLHFQLYVAAERGRAAERIAQASGGRAEDVTAEAFGAVPLELYLPVPAHRAAWTGGAELLVATALADRDVPVAFDVTGRRILLDPDAPPAAPVLALVPVETDFDAVPPAGANAECQDCGGDGGTEEVSGLVMSYASFVEDFEGWLKGAPEFEIHIMGPNSATDTTMARTFQCIGERADFGYRWNMDNLQWSGTVRLFTDGQLAAFERDYPGRAFLIMALEDDDGPCVIKADRDLAGALLRGTREAYNHYNGAKDKRVFTPDGLQRLLQAGKSGIALLSAVASLIKTNDELIGIAVADSVSGRYNPKGNWSVQNKDLKTNGWLKLEVR
jgi:hypothetical protein